MAGFNFSQNIIGLNKTIKELTENKVDWVSNGVLGAKNFNRYPYQQGSMEINGVKFIDNGDGSITLNGNCSLLATYTMHARGVGDKNNLIVPNGKYILSGCPAGGSESKYSIYIGCTKNNAWSMLGRDNGNGALITLDGDDYSKTEVDVTISIETRAGQSFNNVTFYPMLRLASDTDDTWQPYAMTNKDLTDIVKCNQTTAGTYTLQAIVDSNGAVTYEWVSTT